MLSLYRVFSYQSSAGEHAPGGALYVPPQGAGRLDNPKHYRVLYLSVQPQAAVAEAFGPRPAVIWTKDVLRGPPGAAGSARALARYEVSEATAICDLDEPRELIAQRLRPSTVITRDYAVTQEWALRIFRQAREPRWAGVRWWSYYEGGWSNVALWSLAGLRVASVTPLRLTDEAVVLAARAIGRQILP